MNELKPNGENQQVSTEEALRLLFYLLGSFYFWAGMVQIMLKSIK